MCGNLLVMPTMGIEKAVAICMLFICFLCLLRHLLVDGREGGKIKGHPRIAFGGFSSSYECFDRASHPLVTEVSSKAMNWGRVRRVHVIST